MSPVPVRQFSKGRSGIALVTVRGNKVDIVFEDNEQFVSVLLEDCPSYIRGGRQSITLNSSNTEVYGARPVGGTHRCKFVGFTGRDGEPPTVRSVSAKSGVSKAGKKYMIKEHLEFTALFEIVAGKWKGYRLIYNLPYSFEEYRNEDGGHSITLIYGDKVTKFLELCGLDFTNDEIPWSDNVLVYLEKLLVARNKQLAISLNDTGWIKDLSEIPEEDEEEEEEPAAPEKEAPPKQTTKSEKSGKATTAPTVLDVIAQNAKSGDKDALKMLTSLANSNPDAMKKLEEILAE